MQDLNRNKQTIRSLYEEALSGHRLQLIDELFAPEFPGGAAGFRAQIAGLISAFPDIQYTVLDLVAEGERVAVRWQWAGTHAAPFRGFAPTQAKVSNDGMAIFAFSGGRIAGVELQTDRLGFLQQLGIVPSGAGLFVSAPAPDAGAAAVLLNSP
jgi:predicted ester cyclase